MNDIKFVKINHTRRDLCELKAIGEHGGENINKRAHQSQTVCFRIGFRILYDIPVGHPLGEDVETMWVYGDRNPQQRQ